MMGKQSNAVLEEILEANLSNSGVKSLRAVALIAFSI